MITKIVNELKLDLNDEVNLEQVLEKIKELITDKTPETSLRQQIEEKSKEINNLKKQNKENYLSKETAKRRTKKLLKVSGIENSIYQKKLAQISSFHELEAFSQEVIKKEFGKIRNQKKEVENLNIILWVLFASSILIIILLIIKIKRSKLPGQKKITKAK